MNDTPQTDTRIITMLSPLQSGTHEVVLADFARELELENAALRTFAERIAKQKPQKPDHWTECSQCGRNASDADDLINPS